MRKKTRSVLWKALLAVAVVSVVGIGTALVQGNKRFDSRSAPDEEFIWTPPTSGTPVDHYVAEVLVNEQDTLYFNSIPDESTLLEVTYGNKYRMRVAGVDAAGVQGPWSQWSLPFAPELPPPGF